MHLSKKEPERKAILEGKERQTGEQGGEKVEKPTEGDGILHPNPRRRLSVKRGEKEGGMQRAGVSSREKKGKGKGRDSLSLGGKGARIRPLYGRGKIRKMGR